MYDNRGEGLNRAISQICGWLYFILWSISFYPQPMLNLKRGSTDGLAFDYPLLNVFGFVCYTTGSAIFLYSPTVRAEYAARHPLSPKPTVRFNDLCFGLNAVILCSITLSQFWPGLWGWKLVTNRNVKKVTLGVLSGGVLSIILYCGFVMTSSNLDKDVWKWCWIDVTYALTYVKLFVTIFKYIPQIIANHDRKSTVGWSMHQVLLDLGGSIFSFLQLIIDSSAQGDWTGLTGNPVKFGLANVSMLADIIFMIQHFLLYHHRDYEITRWTDPDDGQQHESDPLLQR